MAWPTTIALGGGVVVVVVGGGMEDAKDECVVAEDDDDDVPPLHFTGLRLISLCMLLLFKFVGTIVNQVGGESETSRLKRLVWQHFHDNLSLKL